MAIPRAVARINRDVTNHVSRPLARHLPGFAVVTHVGRRSGRTYRTPVNMFRDGERYVFALTYGADSQWVKNVMAAGSCEVRTQGTTVRLCEPRIFTDPDRRLVPAPVRLVLRILDVSDFLSMRPAPAQ
ncbi:MAG TPA: nitroreductase family deazaflavin-dependent oxidoreductase [Acidimicrobiia bacterium]|nr:nitroreductase family deazaflavin-dependent oxidoreductase [Acidimicrobiia bacterium]